MGSPVSHNICDSSPHSDNYTTCLNICIQTGINCILGVDSYVVHHSYSSSMALPIFIIWHMAGNSLDRHMHHMVYINLGSYLGRCVN